MTGQENSAKVDPDGGAVRGWGTGLVPGQRLAAD